MDLDDASQQNDSICTNVGYIFLVKIKFHYKQLIHPARPCKDS